MSTHARSTAAACRQDGPCAAEPEASERDKFLRACKQCQGTNETAKVSGCKQVSRAVSAVVEVASEFTAPVSPRAAEKVSLRAAAKCQGRFDYSGK
jgi:hypothetical protein